MKLRVTKALTINHTYYAVGDTVEVNDTQGGSYRRLYGWEIIEAGSGPPPAATDKALSKMSKAELLDIAETRGVQHPAKITKAELLALLED